MKILALILSLSLLVFIHELGHYLFARLFKTRVEQFYLFFNPGFSILRAKKCNGKWRLSWFSKKSPEEFAQYPDKTEWGIGWLPFGGYCSIAGMIDESNTSADSLSAEPQEWEYRSKKAWQRLLIVLGGVLMNFVGAIVIFSAMLFVWGKETLPMQNATLGYDYTEVALKNGFQNGDIVQSIDGKKVVDLSEVVEQVLLESPKDITVKRGDSLVTFNLSKDFAKQMLVANPKEFATVRVPFVIDNFAIGSVAQNAGMQIGDSIVALNGVATPTFSDFVKEIAYEKGKEITITYYRNNKKEDVSFTLGSDGKIGAVAKNPTLIYKTEKTEYNLFESIPAGIQVGTETLVNYVKQFKLVFTKEGASQLGGFGAIGSMFPAEWNWAIFWNMTAFLSIILAFMNILPIPALDGGHVMFTLWEMITGKKPGDKFMERAQMIGMILLFGLLIFANGNDLIRWISSKF
ncbi:MAG: RIP metalloprotease RseP [Bacteroidales bacterium]|nr:RIP metalloprotease RseP [Bacteroidales bacterium]